MIESVVITNKVGKLTKKLGVNKFNIEEIFWKAKVKNGIFTSIKRKILDLKLTKTMQEIDQIMLMKQISF